MPRAKIQKSVPRSFRYFHKLSKHPKIFQKAQKLREEMHFENEPHLIPTVIDCSLVTWWKTAWKFFAVKSFFMILLTNNFFSKYWYPLQSKRHVIVTSLKYSPNLLFNFERTGSVEEMCQPYKTHYKKKLMEKINRFKYTALFSLRE